MKRTIADIYLPPVRGMKATAIQAVIKKKVDSWLDSLPKELAKKVRPDVIVTGGCIASMLMGDEPNDFDLYLGSFESAKELAEYYVAQFNACGIIQHGNTKPVEVAVKCSLPIEGVTAGRVYIFVKSSGVAGEGNQTEDAPKYEYFEADPDPSNAEAFIESALKTAEKVEEASKEKKGYRVIHLSGNAITLYGKVQIVIRFFGPPEEIHKNYDFVHVTNYWTEKTGLVLRKEALEAILSRTLVYQGSLYPICSVIRVRKFIARGWNITAGQLLKMTWQINELKLDDLEVLKDQLMGVDAAYFMQLIEILEKDRTKNPELKIDATYIAQLIDKFLD